MNSPEDSSGNTSYKRNACHAGMVRKVPRTDLFRTRAAEPHDGQFCMALHDFSGKDLLGTIRARTFSSHVTKKQRCIFFLAHQEAARAGRSTIDCAGRKLATFALFLFMTVSPWREFLRNTAEKRKQAMLSTTGRDKALELLEDIAEQYFSMNPNHADWEDSDRHFGQVAYLLVEVCTGKALLLIGIGNLTECGAQIHAFQTDKRH